MFRFLLFSFFCLFFVFSVGCEAEKGCEVVEDFSSLRGVPYIVNKDPDDFSIHRLYEGANVQSLNEEAGSGDLTSRFLLALSTIRNVSNIDVDEDPIRGRRMLEELWEVGVVDAGLSLFWLFYNGAGACQNRQLSKLYLEASAEYGLIKSQQILAYAYNGNGLVGLVNKDYSLAKFWFEKAARQGDIISAIVLSGMYFEGIGGVPNESLAFDWISRAESMPYGDPFFAFSSLGMYYEKGIGTDVNLIQAYKYYDLLSPAGDDDKARLEAQMTPEQIREAIRLSRQWQEEHNIYVPSFYGLEYQEDGTFQ